MTARLLTLTLLTTLSIPVAARAQGLWEQPRYAAILEDANTGEVLYERRADLTRFPASITKVMTLYLAFDALANGHCRLDDRIAISRHAANQPPSKLGLRVGETISVEEAMRVIAVKSANDIAVALAEHLAGTEPAFVAQMNAKAASLGMRGTHFMNANGLPDAAHYTTARDLATLSSALLKNHADRYAFFSTPDYVRAGRVTLNHNHLLGQVPGVDGIKTGYTASAGYTLAASAVRDGRRLIAIVLGSPTGHARDNNVAQLLDAGFTVMQQRVLGLQTSVAGLLGEGGAVPFAAVPFAAVPFAAVPFVASPIRIAPRADPIGQLITGWGRKPPSARPAASPLATNQSSF
jgi:D-alanyl-D-alanine carboxypeptidase